MKTLTANKRGILYFFVHFSVETACFYYLFSGAYGGEGWWLVALVFDAIAFLPQSVIGVIADKFPRLPYGVIGLAMMLLALFLPFGWVGLIILTLGNATTHVDGAEKTLRGANGKITPNALFVGGGSFGVITGRLLGVHANQFTVLIPAICIIFSVLLIILFIRNVDENVAVGEGEKPELLSPDVANKNLPDYLIMVVVIVAVAVRAYIGYAVPTEWSVTEFHLILLYCYMGVGKSLGGVLADKIGYKITTLISIVGALPFLILGNTYPVVSLTGTLLFSMTMPITVGIIYSVFPDLAGFAFGITTIGLFVGSLPAFCITLPDLITQQIVVTVLSAVALALILISLKRGKRI